MNYPVEWRRMGRMALAHGRNAEGCVLLIGLDTRHGDLALTPRRSGTLHPKL
jgi:hypothetical protein